MKKSEFKKLIKESLVELLEEEVLQNKVDNMIQESLMKSNFLSYLISEVLSVDSLGRDSIVENQEIGIDIIDDEESVEPKKEESTVKPNFSPHFMQDDTPMNEKLKRAEEKIGISGIFEGLEPIPPESDMGLNETGTDLSIFDSVSNKWSELIKD